MGNDELLDYIYDAFYKTSSKIGAAFEEINGFLDQVETNIDVDLDDVPFGWYSDSVEYYLDAIEKELHYTEDEIVSIHKKLNKTVDDFE